MTGPTDDVSEWVEQTSAFNRVQSIARTSSEPRSMPYIASEAHVSETTAKEYLERLVDVNVLLKIRREGETVYSEDPIYTRIQTLRELCEKHDRDGLIELRSRLYSRVEEWRIKYSVESPADLRAQAAESESTARTREIRDDARDWDLVAYRLSVVEDAIEEGWDWFSVTQVCGHSAVTGLYSVSSEMPSQCSESRFLSDWIREEINIAPDPIFGHYG